MSTRTILLAAIAAALLMVAGYVASDRSASRSAPPEVTGSELFPGLYDRMNEVRSVQVRGTDSDMSFELRGDAWVSVDRDGYPIQDDNLRALLVGLAELELVEAKTRNAANFDQLGVQPVGGSPEAESQSSEVTLLDGEGGTVAALIVGKPRSGGRGNTFYARRPAEDQAWLVEGKRPALPTTPDAWLDKQVVRIDRNDVAAARIQHADGEVLTISKETPDANFKPHELPEGRELSYDSVAGTVAGALQFVNFEDVIAAPDFEAPGDPEAVTSLWTRDGLRVTVELWDLDGKPHARLAAAYDLEGTPELAVAGPLPAPDELEEGEARAEATPRPREEVEAEAADLNARFERWVYVLPTYTRTNLTKRIDSLLKPLPEPEEEALPTDEDAGPLDIDLLGGSPPAVEDAAEPQPTDDGGESDDADDGDSPTSGAETDGPAAPEAEDPAPSGSDG